MTDNLWTALAKAQAEMKNAPLNCVNPHFKSKYADLASIRDAVIPTLAKHGLSVTQTTHYEDGNLVLHTTLWGPDGHSIESAYPLPVDKPQVMGSAITYARRYTLAALVGIAAEEDDDANAAQQGPKPKHQASVKRTTNGSQDAAQPPAPEALTGDPRAIKVEHINGEPDWTGYCAVLKATLAACQYPLQVTAWWEANKEPLKNLNVAHPKWHAALENMMDDRVATLKEETLAA